MTGEEVKTIHSCLQPPQPGRSYFPFPPWLCHGRLKRCNGLIVWKYALLVGCLSLGCRSTTQNVQYVPPSPTITGSDEKTAYPSDESGITTDSQSDQVSHPTQTDEHSQTMPASKPESGIVRDDSVPSPETLQHRQQIEELQSQLSALQKQLNSNQSTLSDLQSDLTGANSEITKLTQNLQYYRGELHRLQKDMATQHSADLAMLDSLSAQIGDLLKRAEGDVDRQAAPPVPALRN